MAYNVGDKVRFNKTVEEKHKSGMYTFILAHLDEIGTVMDNSNQVLNDGQQIVQVSNYPRGFVACEENFTLVSRRIGSIDISYDPSLDGFVQACEASTASSNTDFTHPIENVTDTTFLIATVMHLWKLLDDISTVGDIAKSDDKLYRAMADRLCEQRGNAIISDGFNLFVAPKFTEELKDDATEKA